MLLLYLHVAAATIHLISCVLSIAVHIDVSTDITVPKHQYHSDPVHTVTTHEKVLEQNPMVWISANEGFTMFSHLIAIFYLWNNDGMRKYESLRRTIEYSLTAGILQIALVMGVGSVALHDIFLLLIINIAMQVMGYLMDYSDNRMLLSAGGFLLLAAEIQYVALNALRLEGVNTDYFVLMGVFYALFYIGFGLVKVFRLTYESEIYVLMSVTSKVTLSWLLIGNIFEGFKEMDVKTSPDFTDLDWRAVQWGVVLISVIGLAIGIPAIQTMRPYMGREDEIQRKSAELRRLQGQQYKDLRY